MRVAAVVSDLMLFSRIESAATAAGASLIRLDSPRELPDDLDVILVDWSARQPDWARTLRSLPPVARVILFGRHTDLGAHAEARAAGLGPMWARSALVARLPAVMSGRVASRSSAIGTTALSGDSAQRHGENVVHKGIVRGGTGE